MGLPYETACGQAQFLPKLDYDFGAIPATWRMWGKYLAGFLGTKGCPFSFHSKLQRKRFCIVCKIIVSIRNHRSCWASSIFPGCCSKSESVAVAEVGEGGKCRVGSVKVDILFAVIIKGCRFNDRHYNDASRGSNIYSSVQVKTLLRAV